MTLPTKQICKRLGQALALHPVAWLLAGGTLFWIWGGLIPRIKMEPQRNDDGEKSASRKRLGRGASGSSGALASLSIIDGFLDRERLRRTRAMGCAGGTRGCLFILTSGALTSRLINNLTLQYPRHNWAVGLRNGQWAGL